ncbi:MAG TPA: sigma-70 family RNA polymerase sigma factor [Cyclobacteriaceae bacterium]|nr:sigma-70 family RNA polymerase sigma factor [Cyclobacteriaceae bacterium]
MEVQYVNIHAGLIEQCRAGERHAFKQLYELYAKGMYNVCYRIVRDEDDAHDVLQEAFISAFHHLGSYRAESSFGAWLKRIAVNKAINFLRKKRELALNDDEDFDVMEEESQTEPDLHSIERIKRAIALLPEGYRLVLSLYLLEGYDHKEIAEILNISESTSKSQFNRSKKKLKEILAGGV